MKLQASLLPGWQHRIILISFPRALWESLGLLLLKLLLGTYGNTNSIELFESVLVMHLYSVKIKMLCSCRISVHCLIKWVTKNSLHEKWELVHAAQFSNEGDCCKVNKTIASC